MAVALTATGQANTAALAASLTLAAFDAAGATALVVFVGTRSSSAQAVTGVTYGGDPPTGQACTQHSLTAGTFGRLYSFKLVNPASGAHDLVVTMSAADHAALIVRALSGTHATEPCRAHNETIDVTATADAITVTSTSAVSGDLCLDACQLISGINPTMNADAGQGNAVTLQASTDPVALKLGASTEAGASGIAMGWSGWNNQRCRIVIVPIAPAAGAGGTGGSGMMLMGVG